MFHNYPFEGVTHIRKIESEDETDTLLIPINNVKEKVLLVNCRAGRYLSTIPNTVEIQ